MDIKILRNLEETIGRRNLRDRHHQLIQKRITVNLGLLKWKSGAAAHDRSGQPDKISWNAMQQIRPHHEEHLLDRTAQSVRYGETIHDASEKPDSAVSKEEADSETFVMGSDSAEFLNKVEDQVRKRQKVKRCRFRRRAFNDLENVHGCDDECGDTHGKISSRFKIPS